MRIIPQLLLFHLLLLMLALSTRAQVPYARWASAFTPFPSANLSPKDMIVDSKGNMIIVGQFGGSIDFDPTTSFGTLTSMGSGPNAFICKLNRNGSYLWAKALGGSSGANGITTDETGNIYLTGYFSGTVDFDPGSSTVNLSAAANTDVFISKFDSSGNYVWAKSFKGPGGGDQGNGIALDGSSNIYVTGGFSGTADFDPDTSAAATANISSAGSTDIFVVKLSASGTFSWAKRMGGSKGDAVGRIILDPFGNIFTSGTFNSTDADFDPGPGVATLAADSIDAFVSKLDANGNYLWAKCIGGKKVDAIGEIVTDAKGNIYMSGQFMDTVDFDPGSATTLVAAPNKLYPSAFVSRLDASGAFLWVKTFGGTGTTQLASMAMDKIGNIFTTGRFTATTDFDPGPGVQNLTVANGGIFVSKLDTSGIYVWAHSMGASTGPYGGIKILVDDSAYIYTAGNFGGTIDFDPSTGVINLSGGAYSGFATKWGEMPSTGIVTYTGTSNKSLSLFPQPALNTIEIHGGDPALYNQEVVVYSMEGMVVDRFSLQAKLSLDVARWAPGNYFMRLPDGETLRVTKL